MHPYWVLSKKPAYSKLLHSLAIEYQENREWFRRDLVDVFEQFMNLRAIYPRLLGFFMNELALNFSHISNESRIRVMNVFIKLRIKPEDYLLKSIRKLAENPDTNHFQSILEIYFRLGFVDLDALAEVDSLASKLETLDSNVRVSLISYYALFPLE